MRDLAGIVERIHVLEYTRPYSFRKQVKALQTEYKATFNNRNQGKAKTATVTTTHIWSAYNASEYTESEHATNLNIWK